MPSNNIAKLVIAQPLADHDGAAIFAFEILTFNLQSGVVLKRVMFAPDLEHQTEVLERDVGMAFLGKVLAGDTAQSYLPARRAELECVEDMELILSTLAQELFGSNLGADVYWWQAWKSYPVLRDFYVQNMEVLSRVWELPFVQDAGSFVGWTIRGLNESVDIFELINEISQRIVSASLPETPTPEAV